MKILVVLSEYGYWGEKLVGPLLALDKQGYAIEFITPKGKRAHALPPRMDATYIAPSLGRNVVSSTMQQAVIQLEQYQRLENPNALEQLLPERPYYHHPSYFDLSYPAIYFCQMAQSVGVDSMRIAHREESSEVLDKILSHNRPFLMELLLDGDYETSQVGGRSVDNKLTALQIVTQKLDFDVMQL